MKTNPESIHASIDEVIATHRPVATATHTPFSAASALARQNIAAITSGKWKVQTSADGMTDIVSGTNFVCRVGSSDFPSVLHDAALIAAAPATLAERDRLKEVNGELVKAVQAAADLLAKIPAFGDSIGTEINKAQCGMALRQLVAALTLASAK